MIYSREEAIQLLKQKTKNSFEGILAHSQAVEKLALFIANQIECDKNIVMLGSLLHDIGRYKYPPQNPQAIKHGIEGAKILAEVGINQKIVEITKNHIGAGITPQDIKEQNLPLPIDDYTPKSIEEKIVAYADNCVANDVIKDVFYPIERFKRKHGVEQANRVISMHNELFNAGFKVNIDDREIKELSLLKE